MATPPLWRLLAAGILASALTGSAQAEAQGTPICPKELDTLDLSTEGYARHGQGFAATVSNFGGADVSNVALGTTAENASPVIRPVDMSGGQAVVVLAAPSTGNQFFLSLEWDQDAGKQSACHGRIVQALPLVPVDASVGHPGAPRVVGRYRLYYRSLRTTRITFVWSIRPRCDYFGCTSDIRVSGGGGGLLRLIDSEAGTYATSWRGGNTRENCIVTTTNRFTGQVLRRRTIRNAWQASYRVEVTVRRTENGSAEVLSGTWKATNKPTAAARRRGCNRTYRYRDAVRLERR